MDKVKVPSNVINKQLYRKVKLEADKVYKRPTSAYKSMWISKEYQKRGGKYTGEKKSLTGRWRQEKWIQVIPYVKNNKIIKLLFVGRIIKKIKFVALLLELIKTHLLL